MVASIWRRGTRTVVVYEIGDADAEERRVETRVEACDAFPLNYSTNSIEGGGIGSLGFDLGAGGEGDEWITGNLFLSTRW